MHTSAERFTRHQSFPEWADSWRRDVALAIRSLSHSWGFMFAVILTLALGLGTNAAIFSVLDQVFLRAPSGVTAPSQLRRLWLEQPAGRSKTPSISKTLSYHQYQSVVPAIADQMQLALYTLKSGATVGRSSNPETATIAYATANYFSTAGVRLILGRTFSDAEASVHGASPVVVIGNAFWRRRLGADPAAIGKTLTVDNHDYTIVGVAPADFAGVDLQETELWLPLGAFPSRETARVGFWESTVIQFLAFGRIAPGANDRLVESRATNAYRHTPRTDFATSDSAQIFFRSILDARGVAARPQEASVALRLGFVAIIVLLLTAANVVNLLLARAMTRRRESAVRLALGISRARLMRLFVIESALMASAAGGAALLSAQITGGALRSLLLPGTTFSSGVLHWQVVVFTVALSLVTGVLAGVVPAMQATKADLSLSLKSGARDGLGDRSMIPGILVGTQVALSVMLLVGAALFVSSFRSVERVRIGFDVPQLAYASVQLPSGERADTNGFAVSMRGVGERVQRAPGVEDVAFAWTEPMTQFGAVRFYTATDSSSRPDLPMPTASNVSSNYFKTIGLPFSRGVTFSDQAPGSASVVVNHALATAFWPDRDPIGQCIYLQQRESACLSVVGVVNDAVRQQVIEEPTPQLYIPLFGSVRGQRPPSVLVIRADPERLAFAMRQATQALHEAFPRGEPQVVPMADRLAPLYRPWRLAASLFTMFGLLALVVAALGIYSSVSYTVSQRVREIGVRIALGAAIHDVLRHVVGAGVRPVVTGCGVGAVLSLVTGRLISSLLYGISYWNPVIIVGAVTTLLSISVIAACIPALRVARIDPARAMIAE